MRNKTLINIIILAIIVVGGYLIFVDKDKAVTEGEIQTNPPVPAGEVVSVPGLKVPDGFKIIEFAKNLPGARVIETDPKGRLLVSQTKEGKISVIEIDSSGMAGNPKTLVSGLNNPHGMAWQCAEAACFLFVAESDKLTRFIYDPATVTVTNKTKLADIGYEGDGHFTRSLLFLPSPNENTLLVSVGSSCNVCNEEDPDLAKILAYDLRTGKLTEYAKGLRNAVLMTLDPLSGRVFATENSRDNLGDDIPPDEINIIEKGKNYGWPICYGKNIHDTDFDKNTYIRNPCMEPFETPSFVDLQAHSAPLGLSFIQEEGWPETYWYNLLVAYHGSWNRSEATGYKIVRIKMNSKGQYLGTEDFITGWLTDPTKQGAKQKGRPVDIKVFPGGTAYISDDLAGVVYKLSRTSL